MLKQKVSRLKKILTILLAVLFVLSVTTVAVSAHGGELPSLRRAKSFSGK